MANIIRKKTNARMSQIVEHAGIVYLSGQVPKDTSADIAGQTHSVLEKIEGLLSEVGTSKENILSATIYLKSMEDFGVMNEIWDLWFPDGIAPSRTCVEANLARGEVRIEITVVASIN